jgi:superfamily II DNA or RNA helicase
LDELNLEYATQYTKELEVPEYDNITPDYLGSSVKMHDYQVSASNAALAAQRGIIKCATGGGKTVMFTSILKAMQGRYPALVLFRNKSLVSQTYDVFKTHGLNNIGRFINHMPS